MSCLGFIHIHARKKWLVVGVNKSGGYIHTHVYLCIYIYIYVFFCSFNGFKHFAPGR